MRSWWVLSAATESRQRGFTLLEVLVALSIFAVIGVASYRVLDTLLLASERYRAHDEQWRALQRGLWILENDLRYAVPRTVVDNYGEREAALTSTDLDYDLLLTRNGWLNPLGLPRGDLQRVGYLWGSEEDADGNAEPVLYRDYWTVLDRGQTSEPQRQVLLRRIEDVQWRYLDDQGQWQADWPATDNLRAGIDPWQDNRPVAVELRLQHQTFGELIRLISIGELPLNDAAAEVPDG